jgi:general secretion pathway protein H
MRSERMDVDAAARELVGALRLARGQAIARNAPVAVVVDPAAHAYRVGDGAPRRLPAGLTVSVLAPGPPVRTIAGTAVGTIIFTGDGGSSGGRIDMAGRSHHVSIAVSWLTGRVSVADAR